MNLPQTAHRQDRTEVYFVSDTHFGTRRDETEKRTRFRALANRVREAGGALYILGDLLDFGFPYGSVIPKVVVPVLRTLENLVEAGSPVYFLGGNHDFWMESYFREETHLQVVPEGIVVEAQGRKLQLLHGDGLGRGDWGYKMLKRTLRNPVAIALFRCLHPDLGVALGLRCSHVSRTSSHEHTTDTGDLFRRVALPRLRKGADAVLMGHHHVLHHQKDAAGEFLILGDGFRQFTCARLKEGALSLIPWPEAEIE